MNKIRLYFKDRNSVSFFTSTRLRTPIERAVQPPREAEERERAWQRGCCCSIKKNKPRQNHEPRPPTAARLKSLFCHVIDEAMSRVNCSLFLASLLLITFCRSQLKGALSQEFCCFQLHSLLKSLPGTFTLSQNAQMD